MGCSVSATEIANQIVHCNGCEILRQPRYDVDNPRVGRKYEILSGKIDMLINRLDQGEMISIDLSKRLLGRIDKIIENCLNPYWVDRLVCQKERLNPTDVTWVRSDSGVQFSTQRQFNPSYNFSKTLLTAGLLTGSMVASAESARAPVCYSNHSLRPICGVADGFVQESSGTRMDQCFEKNTHLENRRVKMCPSHLDQIPYTREGSLLDAIERNEWDKFNQTLDEGPLEGKLVDSAVYKAIASNRPEMINWLLDQCPISNWLRGEILFYAIEKNRLELFSKVLNAGSISENEWSIAFFNAIKSDRPEMLNRLLDTGSISGSRQVDVFRYAEKHHRPELISKMLKLNPISREGQDFAFSYIIPENRWDLFQQILENGPIFPESQSLAIRQAIDSKRFEMLSRLLDAGPVSDEHLQNNVVDYALEEDRPELLNKLPRHKFQIYPWPREKLILHATRHNLQEWIDVGLNAAPPSDISRYAVLEWAIKNNQMEYFNRMLEAGPFSANFEFLSRIYYLAIDAANFKRTEMISRLGTMFVEARGVAVSYALENNLPDLFNQMLDNGPIPRGDWWRNLIKVAKDRPEMLSRLLKNDFQNTIRKVVVAAGCLVGVGVAIFLNDAVLR